jgi:hypothetical protein
LLHFPFRCGFVARITSDSAEGALRSIVDGWFFSLEEQVLGDGRLAPEDGAGLMEATTRLMEQRLAGITRTAPAFSSVLRAYRRALLDHQPELAEGLIAWLGGQRNVAASIKRVAGVKGDIDHFSATHFLAGYYRMQ